MPTLFIDYENGNDNWGGSSFAPLASGTDGAISSIVSAYATFTSSSANFPNDNTIAQTKNAAWYSNNLIINSVSSNITLSKDTLSPPSGINATVYKIIENANNTQHYISSVNQYTPIYVGTQYTLSAYFKANGRNKILIRYDADTRMARYNLSNGTVEATGASATADITSVGDNWYRLSLTITTPAGTGYSAENWQIMLEEDSYMDLTFASTTYVGNGTSGIYICGLQIENSASATTYEKPPEQCLSIFNGTSYISFYITERINSTTLRINLIGGGTSLSTQSSRQYFIGGRWKTISTTGANSARLVPGDNIRVMGSPEPTILGSGTWSTLTGPAGAATSNISTASNTSPIVITCASTMATLNISDGDTVLITTALGNIHANGVWTVTNVSGNSCSLVGSSGNAAYTGGGILRKITHRTVSLNNSVTQNIASHGNRGEGRTVWTPVSGGNVSTLFDTTDTKEGDVSDYIGITAGFTTGKAAYKTLPSTLNLSGYQQLSFWIKITSGNLNTLNTDASLVLCSDSTGDIPVNVFNIPVFAILNRWVPCTVNLGVNLGSSINSIALYINTDRGAQVYYISNIIACKSASDADSLSLQSLISKNTGDELWYPIMSINGTRVIIDCGTTHNNNPTSSANRGGYYGITENTLTYKRETIKTIMVSSANTVVQEIQEAGTITAPFNYEFGWDRTNMSIQNLRTYFDGLNGLGWGLYMTTKNYVNINNIACVRYDRGIRLITSLYGNHGLLEGVCNSTTAIDLSSAQSKNTYVNLRACSNIGFGISHDFGVNSNTYEKIISIGNISNSIYNSRGFSNNKINYILSATSNYGMFFEGGGTDNIYISGNFIQNAADGVRYYGSHNENFINCMTSGNQNNYGFTIFGGDLYLKNCIINESLECGLGGFSNGRIYSHNHDNTNGNHLIFSDYGLITAQTVVRYNSTGYAWRLSPLQSLYRSAMYPLDFIIGKVAVNANNMVVIKAWLRKNSNIINIGLRIKGGQIGGVPNDITSYSNAPIDTWQQVTLTFTPTEVGVIEIIAETYYISTTATGTETAYIDDISITQA